MIKHTIYYNGVVKIKNNRCVICHNKEKYMGTKFCKDCVDDKEKIKKYYDNLEKRRKYIKGELIHSFDELLEQEFVYVHNKIYHNGWVKSWQFRTVENYLKRNNIYKAIKKSTLNSDDIDA